MYKTSCKTDKNFLRYSMFFTADLLGPVPALRFSKKPSSVRVKQNSSKTNVEKLEFLNSLNTKTLANHPSDLSENELRETDLFDSMKSMKNSKTLGHDGLEKEFCEISRKNQKLL